MKAVVYAQYGSPEVLHLQEVAKPVPGDDEVLVKVHAVSPNALDGHLMRGRPAQSRRAFGFPHPQAPILGADIAGRVEAVDKSATPFQPGDEVCGGIGKGGFAEYVAVREKALVLKPATVSFEAAAAIPIAAVTALPALRDNGQIQPGPQVLINGASGEVGTLTVQLAKAFGAEVTPGCSTRHGDQARAGGQPRD
jgi:NADPH:quinone reductase-like Zn-dependent oxidoreductase